jgi:multidrug/hemolysin transport system permease protein
MKTIGALIKRNVKLFFKDKGTFFTSLITPVILLVLYATFLYNVYEDSFTTNVPEGMVFPGETLQGLVGGLLLSSLLAVSTVTVSFCANLCMISDKYLGAKGDICISPVKPRSLALSYYLSTVINGMIISLVATMMGCIYLACTGWYLSFADVLCFLLDVTLLVLFGTALSSLICYPLTTQGQLSAVGSIISAGYGFICGAYMPMSQFSDGLRSVLSFFPGTYGTSLLRNHALGGVFKELEAQNFPLEAIESMKSVADCNPQFFGNTVEVWQMYLVLAGVTALLIGAYILLNVFGEKRKTK